MHSPACPSNTPTQHLKQTSPIISRRSAVILISVLPLTLLPPQPLLARERRNRKNIPLEDYQTTSDGLKYYDLVEGSGPVAEKGSTVQVHFDCVYRGITAVSSRESKLLAGNRIIAQVICFYCSLTISENHNIFL
nr:peptidyl-prolyl cis-trans isomerase FKBP18, chloroplastic [Ipomoea batatas]